MPNDTQDENKSLPDDLRISYGGAVKSLANDDFELCLYKFTSADRKDLTHEYFDAQTDFVESAYPFNGKLLYHHGLDSDVSIIPIGDIVSAERRADGIYGKPVINFAQCYKAYLQSLQNQPADWLAEQERSAEDYELMIKHLMRAGKLSGSGGALPQSVIVDDTGHIKRWASIEYSLTPTPAEWEFTRLQHVKSLPSVSLRELGTQVKEVNQQGSSVPINLAIKGTIATMDMEQLKQLISDVIAPLLAALRGQSDSSVNPDALGDATKEQAMSELSANQDMMKSLTAAQVEERVMAIAGELIQGAVKATLEKRDKADALVAGAFGAAKAAFQPLGRAAVKGFSAPNQSNGQQSGNFKGMGEVGDIQKYAGLSAPEMALALKLAMIPAQASGLSNVHPLQVVSEDFYRTMVGKMIDYANSEPHKVTPYVDDKGEHARHPEWVKTVQLTNRALKSAIPFKANELDASNIATQGQEWVGQYWESDIWLRAREVRIYEQLIQKGMMQKDIPQGYSTAKFPLEGNDPTVYTAPEANSVDSTGRPEVTAKITPFTTGNVTLTPKEWKAATSYTVVLGEDSIIDVAPQVNYQLTQVIQETIEAGMINADVATGANTNINDIDGTPGTGLQTPYYIAFDGFRKEPLITHTAYSRDAGNALSLEDYRATLALMGSPQRSRVERMAFIIDPNTETASLAIPELATDDVRHTFATITSGVLRNVYGVDVFKSGFLLNSNTAGKVAVTTPTNNKRGSILLVYAPYFGFGYKRNIQIETARDILSGSNIYVVSLRLGVVSRGLSSAAISYNIQNGSG